MDLNNIIDQMTDQTYMEYPTQQKEYTFFSSVHEIFSKMDYMFGHKTRFK